MPAPAPGSILEKAFVGLLLIVTGSAAMAETLRVAGNRLFVPVEINGTSVAALLDSGAEMTFVDTAFAERLSLSTLGSETAKGTGGTADVTFVEHVDIACAGVELDDKTIAVLDLGDISRRLVGEPVHMIIGRELFDAARLLIDVEGGRIERVGVEFEPDGVRLPMTDNRGIKQIPISIEDAENVYADFDLGNGSEVLVGRRYAAEHGLLTPARIVGRKQGGGIGGARSRYLIVLGSLVLAGVEFRDVTAAIDDTEQAAEANIGVSLLRHFVVTVDFAENALWLLERNEAGTGR